MVYGIRYIDNYSGKTIFDEIKNYIKQYGLKITLIKAIRDLYPIIPLYLYHKIYDRYFKYEGCRIKYFIRLARIINSERIVEIPLTIKLIQKTKFDSCLEIGDTVSKYFTFPHDIIDKYERRHNIIQADAYSYNFPVKYDLIISISTIEHIGKDEDKVFPEKAVLTLKRLMQQLNTHGLLFVTVPINYNEELDTFIRSNPSELNICFLARISFTNMWRQVSKETAFQHTYNYSYFHANSIAIITYIRK